MAFPCGYCERKFISEESLAQHVDSKHKNLEKECEGNSLRKVIVFVLIGLIVVFLGMVIVSYSQRSGVYDDFAMCLADKGAVVYGNDFCSYTGKQLNYFGRSERKLNYVKCASNRELCDSKGITVTPTWEYEGKMYEGVQTFERLSAITGCEVDGL